MSSRKKVAKKLHLPRHTIANMSYLLFARYLSIAVFSAFILSCALSGGSANLSHEDCERLTSSPDSCIIDTLGILGTIFPKNDTIQGDSSDNGPMSTWTPAKPEIMLAEQIFKRCIKNSFRCIDTGYTSFYRQYAGRGQYNNTILIHGIRMSKEVTICGARSFWINIYETGCSIFDATIDIRLGTCDIVLKEDSSQ
jgi:hypothetical protein